LKVRVSKDLTAKYDILSDVTASPTRIEIINKLSGSSDGLPFEEIAKQLSPNTVDIQRHLDVLLKDKLIENKNGMYTLSRDGQNIYSVLVEVAKKAKAEKIFSTV
jgi:predicted transcriptional regulator